jgi:hypothetical protein
MPAREKRAKIARAFLGPTRLIANFDQARKAVE